MKQLHEVREEYGGVYVTRFPDGLLVPWKPLSVGDYIKYTHDHNRHFILSSRLEDEIFRKCVVDDSLVRQLPFLKAGVITTVVLNIWQYSGPSDISSFNHDLDVARAILNADGTRAIHDLVQVITLAFPYKPEEVYEMEYETFLLRLAQSEKKLLELGAIKEPISMKDTSQEQKRPSPLDEFIKGEAAAKPKVDAKKLWDQQQGLIPPDEPVKGPARQLWERHQQQVKHAPLKKRKQVQIHGKQWWKDSPVLEAKMNHNIDFQTESAEMHVLAATSHEKVDAHIDRVKMVQDTAWVYKDLIEAMKKRKSTG